MDASSIGRRGCLFEELWLRSRRPRRDSDDPGKTNLSELTGAVVGLNEAPSCSYNALQTFVLDKSLLVTWGNGVRASSDCGDNFYLVLRKSQPGVFGQLSTHVVDILVCGSPSAFPVIPRLPTLRFGELKSKALVVGDTAT